MGVSTVTWIFVFRSLGSDSRVFPLSTAALNEKDEQLAIAIPEQTVRQKLWHIHRTFDIVPVRRMLFGRLAIRLHKRH